MHSSTQGNYYENEYVQSNPAPEITYNQVISDATPEIPEEMPYQDNNMEELGIH